EGHFRTEPEHGTGLYVFGLPNESERKVDFGLQIPNMLSMLVHFDPNKPVQGLDQTPPRDWPPIAIPFLAFHLMVALGGFFLGITALGLFFLWRNKLHETRWLLWTFVFAVIGPFLANEAGWTAAEVGRQPWVVYGLLRTSDGVSKNLPPEHVLIGICMF